MPVSGPTPEERSYPYLWRFWRDVPERGHIAIFDRTWYGRVLVERVRGFAAAPDWRRAYDEINEFERQLTESGLIVAKFWLQVSKAEQLRRFKARDEDPLKRFKVDPEDWTNRTFYDAYQTAAAEMVERTHTAHGSKTGNSCGRGDCCRLSAVPHPATAAEGKVVQVRALFGHSTTLCAYDPWPPIWIRGE